MPCPLLGDPDIEPTWPQGPSLIRCGHKPDRNPAAQHFDSEQFRPAPKTYQRLPEQPQRAVSWPRRVPEGSP
jgi:hypothetical protein